MPRKRRQNTFTTKHFISIKRRKRIKRQNQAEEHQLQLQQQHQLLTQPNDMQNEQQQQQLQLQQRQQLTQLSEMPDQEQQQLQQQQLTQLNDMQNEQQQQLQLQQRQQLTQLNTMVRTNYPQKLTVDMERMEKAVLAIKRDKLTISKAVQRFAVPRSTLKPFRKQASKELSNVVAPRVPGSTSVFSDECEATLAEYLERCNGNFYGISSKEVRGMAFDFAKQIHLNIPASWDKTQMAGAVWLQGFRKRYKGITLRNSKKAYMTDFSTNLKTVVNAERLTASRFWYMGETGIAMMQSKNYVVSNRTTAVECDTPLVTMALTVSASGNYLPPFFIFPCEEFQNHFLDSGPSGCAGAANSKCWMDSVHFFEYLQFFQSHVHASTESPVLIVLENHKSRFSIGVIDFCHANGILLLSHKFSKVKLLDQPSINVAWKITINLLCERKTSANADKKITMKEIPEIVKTTLPLVLTHERILTAFKRAGIAKYFANIQLNTNKIDTKELKCAPSTESENFNTNLCNTATIKTEKTDSLEDKYLCYSLKSQIKEEPALEIVDVAADYTPLWEKEEANTSNAVKEEPNTEIVDKATENTTSWQKEDLNTMKPNWLFSIKEEPTTEILDEANAPKPQYLSSIIEVPTVEIVDKTTGYTTQWQEVNSNTLQSKCTCLVKDVNINDEPTVEIVDISTGYTTFWQKVVANESMPKCICLIKHENINEEPALAIVKVEDTTLEEEPCSVQDESLAQKLPDHEHLQQSIYLDNVKNKIEKLPGIPLQPAGAGEQSKTIVTKQSCEKRSDLSFENIIPNMPNDKLLPKFCVEELKNKIKKLPGLKFQTTKAHIRPTLQCSKIIEKPTDRVMKKIAAPISKTLATLQCDICFKKMPSLKNLQAHHKSHICKDLVPFLSFKKIIGKK